MPVIPVSRVVFPKRIIGKNWRAEEEERHKGSLTHKKLQLHTMDSHKVQSQLTQSRFTITYIGTKTCSGGVVFSTE
jgi:hypothetical protein